MTVRTLDELVDEIKKEFVTMPSSSYGVHEGKTYADVIKTPLAVHQSIQHEQIKRLIRTFISEENYRLGKL